MKDDKNEEEPIQKDRPLTTCNICNITLREDRLQRHLRKVHNPINGFNNNISGTKKVNFSEVVAFFNQEKFKQSQQQILQNKTPEKYTKEENSIQSPNQSEKSPWREEKCQRCNKPIYIHKDWINPLLFCKECTAYRKKARHKKHHRPGRLHKPGRLQGVVIKLISQRGTKLQGKHPCCSCGAVIDNPTRYAESNVGPVILCTSCKSRIRIDTFPPKEYDALNLAITGGFFEGNRRRH